MRCKAEGGRTFRTLPLKASLRCALASQTFGLRAVTSTRRWKSSAKLHERHSHRGTETQRDEEMAQGSKQKYDLDRREPVTQADRLANDLIVHAIRREFPDDGILAEESVDTDRRLRKSRVWMIDPLDGTNGFIDGNGDFAVQIGLAQDGDCVLGVVFQPLTGVLYRAVRGQGTWIERPGSAPEKARVSDHTEISTMRLAASRSHRSPRMDVVV